MTSLESSLTLPAIMPEIQRYPSGRELKFKKIALLESELSSIKGSVKSVPKRNTSCSSLMSSSERKEFKKQQIMLNLIEKKIREGRYDENQEVADDLNSLKVQYSDYTTKIAALNGEIFKYQQKMTDLKGNRGNIAGQHQILLAKVQSLNEGVSINKARCDLIDYERGVMSNLISRQSTDNQLELARMNQLREEANKKKLNALLLEKQELMSFEKEKQVQRLCRGLRKNHMTESRQMQELIMDRHKGIQLRAASEISRWERKKELIQISQSVVVEDSEKTFNKWYTQILAQKFLSLFNNYKLQTLIAQNERTIQFFNEASNMYGPLSPEQYPQRYLDSLPERVKIQQSIKQLQLTVSQSQHRNNQAGQRLLELKTQFMSLGTELQKKHQSMMVLENSARNSSYRAEQKLFHIEAWTNATLKKLDGKQEHLSETSAQQRLRSIIDQVQSGLLTST